MRIQDHIKISSAAALLAMPVLKQDVVIPWAASILIDVDHYLWHVVTRRTLSLRAAVRYFEQADPPRLKRARLLHAPLVLALLFALAARTRSRLLWLLLAGLLFHVSLDVFHKWRMDELKASLGTSAQQTCPECGQQCDALQLHTVSKAGSLLDRYNARHFVMLCPECHGKAHHVGVQGE